METLEKRQEELSKKIQANLYELSEITDFMLKLSKTKGAERAEAWRKYTALAEDTAKLRRRRSAIIRAEEDEQSEMDSQWILQDAKQRIL